MADRPLVPIESIGEGRDFAAGKSAPDEKDRTEISGLQQARTHELALIQARMGPIGRLIGSEDTALTISFVVLVLCFMLLAISAIASIWNATVLTALSNDLFKVILAIAGYIFGKLHSKGSADR
jgi:hypothetical protein